MQSVAVLIPCFNEERSVARVIDEARRVLPDAEVYVFDNNSTDGTADIARSHGAVVVREMRQGKGYVVQSMFYKVDADIYVMVDGDATYDLSRLKEMVSIVERDEADMVVGNRLQSYDTRSFRPLHAFGNRLVTSLINRLFGASFSDVMSGLRVMNRYFVKNINVVSGGFQVETEMSIKSMRYAFMVKELGIDYGTRVNGDPSKLNTLKDGMLVLGTITMIFKDYKPLHFFSILSLLMLLCALLSGVVVIKEFIDTRYITHVPLAILATGCSILAILFGVTGVIMDAANRRFDELYYFIRNKR